MRGWPEQAPFDKIIVTAAGEAVPPALKKQVREGGVIVMPVGPQDGIQKLMRLTRTRTGFDEKVLGDVRFVPLIPGRAARL
jgi:protein-L-isoaspartate(D-aspartate) O-methyltransferase